MAILLVPTLADSSQNGNSQESFECGFLSGTDSRKFSKADMQEHGESMNMLYSLIRNSVLTADMSVLGRALASMVYINSSII